MRITLDTNNIEIKSNFKTDEKSATGKKYSTIEIQDNNYNSISMFFNSVNTLKILRQEIDKQIEAFEKDARNNS